MPGSADLLIENGVVLSLDANDTQIPAGKIAVSGDRIVAIGPEDALKDWQAPKVLDAGGGIIMPGLINTHTHVAMSLFRGLADDLPLMTWLNDHIFPAEARLDEQKVFLGAQLGCAEMILAGVTTFCDMYLFEDAVARAARAAGMRAVVGEVLFDFPSPNYGPLPQGFAYTRRLIEAWQGDPLISVAVEPHSPYLCAPELLMEAAALAGEHDALLVIHLAETRDEVNTIMQKYGRTPVEHLADLGILGPRLLACHCVMLTEGDMELLKAHGVKVSHNPESNMKLASGIAPVPALLQKGVCVGLGTDGCASNNNLDLFQEMDTAAKLHKVSTGDPTVMDARTVLRAATIEAARALGMERGTGSLEIGKKADIIVLDTLKPHLTPMYHPYSHLVYAARGSDVTTSVINGRVVMENRRLLTLDLEAVMAGAEAFAREMRAADLD